MRAAHLAAFALSLGALVATGGVTAASPSTPTTSNTTAAGLNVAAAQDAHVVSATKTKIVTQPTSTAVALAANARFTVKATGSHLRYRWSVLARGSSLWQPARSGHAATLRVKQVQAADRGDRYRVVVIGTRGRVTSSRALLTVTRMSPVATDESTDAAEAAAAATATFGDGSSSYLVNVVAADGSGTPAWRDRCAVISYSIDETNAPAAFDGIVSSALATYTSSVGLQFSRTAFDAAEPYADGVTLVFSVHQEAADGAFSAGNVVAYAGPGVLVADDDASFAAAPVFNSFVVFDASQLASESASILAATATHELGHTFNLAHTQDPRELMYPDITAGESSALRSGDLAGLAQTVRAGAAC